MEDMLKRFVEISAEFRSKPLEERLMFISEHRDTFHRILRNIETDVQQLNRQINRQRFINDYLTKMSSNDKAKVVAKAKLTILSEDFCILCSEPHLNQDTFYSSCCERQFGKTCFRTWAIQCMESAPESSTTSDCANNIRCPGCQHVNPIMRGFKCRITNQRVNSNIIYVSNEIFRQLTDDVCSICFDTHLMKDTVQTSCGHKIGKKCIDLWKKHCRQSHLVLTCPVCRTKKPQLFCFQNQTQDVSA